MKYLENPKTQGSGIMCIIPQTSRCPNECIDCFFQSGRSYLEPLKDNLPNLPTADMNHVYRVNDGHDSIFLNDVQMDHLCNTYHHLFYNTSATPKQLAEKDYFENVPFVWTVNPKDYSDSDFYKLDPIPKNLMFVRVRVNTWNLALVDRIVDYYSILGVPIVLTFMAYFNNISDTLKDNPSYIYRKRTLNSYYAITTEAWRTIMKRYENNRWVHSCGKIEGEDGDTHCRFCGNCIREYYATITRIFEGKP